jgi:8-oxo-dGTP pyrophosphatase MutT (NUDIX family)
MASLDLQNDSARCLELESHSAIWTTWTRNDQNSKQYSSSREAANGRWRPVKVERLYRQAAVIPVRICDERVEIALVTTPGGKRWVIPKGSLDEGERPRDAAIRETEEEAGVIGELETKPLGRYQFTRANERYEVEVYLMRVTTVLDSWLESGQRRRRWIAVDKAAALVRPELQPFIQMVERLIRSGKGYLFAP